MLLDKVENQKELKATHAGTLKIGANEISCAVLEDETRILVERSVSETLGTKGGGAYWRKKKEKGAGAMLPEYISHTYLQPYISNELKENLKNRIIYTYNNKKAIGVEASVLPDICDVWIKAKENGALTEQQALIADKAYILLKAFAQVGITALIDEATGYQEFRDKEALRKILDKYIRKELAIWAKRFPDEFYKELFRLKGWQWKGMKVNRPQYVGKLTNDLIYARLAPGVLDALRERTERDEKGVTKNRFHQWLTDDATRELGNHLSGVLALMRASTTWRNFERAINRAYPKFGANLEFLFDLDDD